MRTISPSRFSFFTSLGLGLSLASGCVSSKGREANTNSEKEYTGYATQFGDLGTPYGGCGVPQAQVESTNYAALNVQDTPGDYGGNLARPIEDTAKVGAWENGRNCGRWIRVYLDKSCKGGDNAGRQKSKYCEGGTLEADESSGAFADFVITDSCQDDNLWCRDDRYHVDLAQPGLNTFQKNGQRIAGLREKWGNPQVRWHYIDAPNYKGDIKIGFIKDAAPFWPAIAITHLPRGIHGVEYEVNGSWKSARMNGDNGQVYILEGAQPPYKIKVRDAYNQMLNGGRVYQFGFPCPGERCPVAYTAVNYTTSGGVDSTPTASDPTQADVSIQTAFEGEPATPGKPPVPSNPGNPKPPVSAGKALKVEMKTKSSWDSGMCADLIISNTSANAVSDWTLVVDTHGGTPRPWGMSASKSGSNFVLKPDADWTKKIAAEGSMAQAGFCIDGSGKTPTIVSISP